jgi:glutathione S-transferase
MPTLTLHALPPSHPCMTVDAALRLKGLEFERVDLTPGPHTEEMQKRAFPSGWVPQIG